MTENPRVRNLAILLILILVFVIPAIFIPSNYMLDIVSVLMLLFGIAGLWLIGEETWNSFWNGSADRASVALFGLFALFLSVVVMRSYGILTRNVPAAETALAGTHVYGAMVYCSFIGLWLFSRASAPPTVSTKGGRWGQLFVGIVIGSIVASSRVLEPLLASIGKIFARLF